MLEDRDDDFFEKSPDEIEKREKPEKKPRYSSDDPRYYEEEESQWEHLKPAPYRRGPILWITGMVVVALFVLLWLYLYIFTPRVQQAVQYGYVDDIRKEGTMFSTFEGVMLPYKSLMDSVRPYEGDFVFSTTDQNVATYLLRQQGSGNPVKVEYKEYRFAFPWRGKSRIIVTGVDSVNPKVILPPDRQPETMRQR